MICVLLPNSLGCDRPKERDLQNHVIPEAAGKWRAIGVELLDDISVQELNSIEIDCQNVCLEVNTYMDSASSAYIVWDSQIPGFDDQGSVQPCITTHAQ